MALGTILGIGSAAAGIFGGMAADRAQEKAIERQDEQNLANWKYDWRSAKSNLRFAREGLEIQKENDKNLRKYNWKTEKKQYNYNLRIREYEYQNTLKQYIQSTENYKKQLGFNNMAAAVAFESEQRRHQDVLIGQAFQHQDLTVQSLQEAGEVQANLASGRSSRKVMQSTLAEYGRNLAVMEESLTSAKKQNIANVKGIWRDKYGADLSAEAQRMLRPTISPKIPAPLKPPKPKYQKPNKPLKPPKPIKGAGGGSVNTINAIGDAMGTVSSIFAG